MLLLLCLSAFGLSACDNSPWQAGAAAENALYSGVKETSPRHLDPVASYWGQDTPYTYQVYEPVYGYHYLKRPYELIGKAAEAVSKPRYLDKNGRDLPQDAPAEQIAESVYEVRLKPGILFQPHPCFARDAQGQYLYHAMKPGDLNGRATPLQFEQQGTRELVAEDYVYAFKRHATTRITTPVYGVFAEHIVGLKEYRERIVKEDAKLRAHLDPASLDKPFLDFRRWPLAGVTAPEKHLLRIRIHGKYPQWNYWMAMTFTAPVPWEADAFYAQPGMATLGLSLDTWPVGTGPYMMVEFIKDRRHVLKRNPNYRGTLYPCEGEPGDKAAGLLDDCGKKMPFIDTLVSTVERETLPRQAKFRQGHYDIEVFERTDTGVEYLADMEASEAVRREYEAKGFRLDRLHGIDGFQIGFNMLDPTIGHGDTPEQRHRSRKLRQAISIAIDWEEFVRIFPARGGVAAMGPLPQALFGSREETLAGVNPVTHRVVDGKPVRRSISEARKLMAEAGYPHGRDVDTGRPLILNYDFYLLPTPESKVEIDWVVRQFAKIDIQLEVRATDNNQFQDKVRKGRHQVYFQGWIADYPDAENFLSLLYGPNGKTRSDGEGYANYGNPAYDRLFQRLKLMADGPEKQALIDQMVKILQEDAPWSFGYFPYASAAVQHWVHNSKPSLMVRDHGQYLRLDLAERQQRLAVWNKPVWWPLVAGLAGLGFMAALLWRALNRRERLNARGRVLGPMG